jgi:hypothetical protein
VARSIDPIPPLSPRSRWEAPLHPPAHERDAERQKERQRDTGRRAPSTGAGDANVDGDPPVAGETVNGSPSGRHVDVRA